MILFLDPVVDMIQEFSNSRAVIFRILLNIVMSGHLHEIRLKLLVLAGFPESVSMTNVHDFISLTVDDVDWTIEVLYPVNIRKLVKPERPSKIRKDDPQSGHERCVEHNSGNMVLFCEIAGRSRTNTSTKENNLVSWDINVLR